MDHIWSHKDGEVEAQLIVKMPTDRLPNREECLAVIALCDRASSEFGRIMQIYKKK